MGKAGPLSDIDIAVYWAKNSDARTAFKKKMDLLGKLNQHYQSDNIDLVMLHEAPLLLAHRIVRDGRVIYSKNKKQRLEFEVSAVMRYLDWQPFSEKYAHEVLTRGLTHG